MRVGIPRALLYYNYFPLWKTFFESLGHEIVLSSRTTNKIMDKGVKSCVDDACLPVKLFHGHVMDLIGKVDKIFIPRLISVHPGEFICPKFIGLPEMVKNTVSGLPELIILNFNAHKKLEQGYDGYRDIGKQLGAKKDQILRAINLAKKAQQIFENRLITGSNPLSLLESELKLIPGGTPKGTIALIGHPYLVYDRHISMNACSKLAQRGYRIVFTENISDQEVELACERLPKKLFWSYGKKLLGGGLTILQKEKIDGIIFISSFGCGIDSFIGELLQRFNQREYLIPYSTITLDEHSGAAGFDTRLEAFIDMMEWRGQSGYNISAYGKDVCTSQSNI